MVIRKNLIGATQVKRLNEPLAEPPPRSGLLDPAPIPQNYELPVTPKRERGKAKAAALYELLRTQPFLTDQQIRQHIDCISIYEFMRLVLENQATTRAVINANKAHAKHHAMKANVFVWLDSNFADYKSNAAAARNIVKLQAIEHETALDWINDWKKSRSAKHTLSPC